MELEKIPLNTSLPIDVEGEKILICNANGIHYAIENNCSHQDAPLEKGRIRGKFICCPLHGVRFNLETGEPVGQLTRKPIKTYALEEKGDLLELDLRKTWLSIFKKSKKTPVLFREFGVNCINIIYLTP